MTTQPDQAGTQTRGAPSARWLTPLFYLLIGLAASLALFLAFYWSLRLNSSIFSLINNTQSQPVYLWSYALLTLGTILLFGVNAALLVHRWRKFGPPRIKTQAGAGLGSLVGVAAAACPICGSTLLVTLGITGGLAAFPLQGLELKALSFGLMLLPVWLTTRQLRRPTCANGACPAPRDVSFQTKDMPWFIAIALLIVILAVVGWSWVQDDPAVAYLCVEP